MNACRFQLAQSLAGDQPVRVFHGSDYTGNSGADQRIRTGRRLAEMRTRLQRDIHSRALAVSATSGDIGKRFDFGMVLSRGLRESLSNDLPVPDDDTADFRIGRGQYGTVFRQLQRMFHEKFMSGQR